LIKEDLGNVMNTQVGVFRDRESLEKVKEMLPQFRKRYRNICLDDHGKKFNTELLLALELRSIIDLAETILIGALTREESRGAHSRKDFPNRDDARWLKHILIYSSQDGPRLQNKEVNISKFPPKERTY